MILLNCNRLEKSFSGRTLFRDVSFGIGEGERVGLVGPNGAGKSTLIRILAGLTDADGGNVSRKRGLRVGFMEQTPTFPEGATVMSAVLEKLDDPNEGMAKALQIMSHLSLATVGEDTLVSELSGGWKKRVALARELATEPELLLLDEPTNHLDVSSILWLEEYLRNAPYAVMMITHDRLFLQRVATRILDLDPRNPNHLLSVNGDYAMYVEAKEHELAALQRHEKVQKNQLRREVEWLSRGSIARQTKQSARIEAAAELKESVESLKAQNRPRGLDIEFGKPEHSPQKLMDAENLSKAYGDHVLFTDLNLLITKTRIALLGDNGSGKSTLIRILLGMETPDSGTVKRADPLAYAHFEQTRETIDPTKSVLKNLCPEGDYVHVQGSPMHVRSYLDRFLFPGIKAELPAAKLSGGEQARLRLAQLMLNSSQVLVLDEPTNDLDTETLEVLEGALKDFNGAVILVTHDRYFMDAVADHILAFPPAALEESKLEKFASYFQWETWYKEQLEKVRLKTRAKAAAANDGAKKSRMSFKDKFELENMEGTIAKIEQEISRLTELSQDPNILSDHKKLNEVLGNLGKQQGELEKKFARWAELESKKMKVREALASDAAEVANLVNSAYRGDSSRFGWTTEADFLDGSRISANTASEMIQPEFGKMILVLQENDAGPIIACVYLEKYAGEDNGACYLGMLTVNPKMQDKGLGRMMLEASESFAREWGSKRMILGVIQLRGTLMAWYERRGYRRTDVTQPFPYDQPEAGTPKRPDLHFIMFEKNLI